MIKGEIIMTLITISISKGKLKPDNSGLDIAPTAKIRGKTTIMAINVYLKKDGLDIRLASFGQSNQISIPHSS